jgi:hypothetical protein
MFNINIRIRDNIVIECDGCGKFKQGSRTEKENFLLVQLQPPDTTKRIHKPCLFRPSNFYYCYFTQINPILNIPIRLQYFGRGISISPLHLIQIERGWRKKFVRAMLIWISNQNLLLYWWCQRISITRKSSTSLSRAIHNYKSTWWAV